MSIHITDLSHIYDLHGASPFTALSHISVEIEQNEFVGLIGHTGSGKSTLIQHLNGLILPQSGTVTVNGLTVDKDKTNLKRIRGTVGLVFQYPEHQLFEETVEKDIAFGPKMMGLEDGEISRRVTEAMEMVGLAPELAARSPFELSGGQKRRAAIAGVLAMRPEILVLDEPVAGLDPRGKEEILSVIARYRAEVGATVILVSHNMDDIARVCTRVAVLEHGRLAMYGTPAEVFARAEELSRMGLGVPQATSMSLSLRERGVHVPVCLTLESLAEEILKLYTQKQ